jgi:hypothetical protein
MKKTYRNKPRRPYVKTTKPTMSIQFFVLPVGAASAQLPVRKQQFTSGGGVSYCAPDAPAGRTILPGRPLSRGLNCHTLFHAGDVWETTTAS